MKSREIPLMSFAETETTNLPLRFRATLVPQESSGQQTIIIDSNNGTSYTLCIIGCTL